MARSSVSLLPASASAAAPVVAGRAGGSFETAAWLAAGTSVGSGDVDAAGGVRGRVVEAMFFAGWIFCAVGWDEVKRAMSSRMDRAASQPDKSNKPAPTVCLTRLLIVIPPS